MGAPASGQSRFTQVVGATFGSLRQDPVFLGAVTLIIFALTMGLQLILKAVRAQVSLAPHAGLVAFLGSLAILGFGAVISGVMYARLQRQRSGAAADLDGDFRAGLLAAPSILCVLLAGSAPNLAFTAFNVTAGYQHWVIAPNTNVLIAFGVALVGFVIFLNWSLAPAAAADQPLGWMQALGSSQALLKGNRWRLIGLYLVVIVFSLLTLPATLPYFMAGIRAGAAGNAAVTVPVYGLATLTYVAVIGSAASLLWRLLVFHYYANLRRGTGEQAAAVFS